MVTARLGWRGEHILAYPGYPRELPHKAGTRPKIIRRGDVARKTLNLPDSPCFRLLLGPAGIAGDQRNAHGERRGNSKMDIAIQIISDYLPKCHTIR